MEVYIYRLLTLRHIKMRVCALYGAVRSLREGSLLVTGESEHTLASGKDRKSNVAISILRAREMTQDLAITTLRHFLHCPVALSAAQGPTPTSVGIH